jgi:site-specific recombinase XerD
MTSTGSASAWRYLSARLATPRHFPFLPWSAKQSWTISNTDGFLRYLEDHRHNHVRTRNQRLAALHTLFDYIAGREPQMLGICQQVIAIPMKRAAPAETHFLEHDEIEALLRHLPRTGRLALRDHALLLFLYNTGAWAQEVADLRAGHLQLGEAAIVRLHGKGDKLRTCPLWRQTAQLLAELLYTANEPPATDAPVFCSAPGQALTRFGIYTIVRRHAGHLDDARTNRTVSPHIFRHGPPARGRRRSKRHPRLARARRPHHDEPLRQLSGIASDGRAEYVFPAVGGLKLAANHPGSRTSSLPS